MNMHNNNNNFISLSNNLVPCKDGVLNEEHIFFAGYFPAED